MTPSTFTIHESGRFSTRPSWLTTIAPLGRLHGDEATLIGVCRDINALDGITDWGVASASDIARLELGIGRRLTEVLDQGIAVEIWFDCNADRVADLKPIEVRQFSPARPATISSTQLPMLSTNATRYADFDAAIAEAGVIVERVEKQRIAALSLRREWSIEDMKHRSDWPTDWLLPHWIRDLIREGSRHWLELPNAPLPMPEQPPVIQSAHVEPVQTPAAPVTKGFVATLKGVFA